MRRLSFLPIFTFFLLSGCSCGPGLFSSSSSSEGATCGNGEFSLTSLRVGGAAVCGGVSDSKKVNIQCAPGSGSNGTCTSISNLANYYFVLVPNNNSGTFVDSTAGQLNSCNDLWNAMASATPPTDITAVYFSDPTNDTVSCTDATGCAVTSSLCFSNWDTTIGAAGSTAVSILPGNYLACGFINSNLASFPASGPPPTSGVGLIGISNATAFQSLTVTFSSQIIFNTWTDY